MVAWDFPIWIECLPDLVFDQGTWASHRLMKFDAVIPMRQGSKVLLTLQMGKLRHWNNIGESNSWETKLALLSRLSSPAQHNPTVGDAHTSGYLYCTSWIEGCIINRWYELALLMPITSVCFVDSLHSDGDITTSVITWQPGLACASIHLPFS